MRMTLRGFKDRDAESLETFAGTCGRMAQRLVTSETVCRGWSLTSINVRKAFLKGFTSAELAKTTQEPERRVCFELSGDSVEVLQTLLGYKD